MANEIHLDRLVTAYDAFQAFEERCYTLLHAIVDQPQPDADLQRRLMHAALARLATGHDMDEAVTDIGWVMGPWEILGCLTLGASMVLFEGVPDFPDPGRLWEMVARHRVTHLGVAPTVIRALKEKGT